MVSVIGDGRMTKEQANKEAEKIFMEAARKSDVLIEKAKKEGTWQDGLDTKNGVSDEVYKEAKKKLELLKTLIDED